MIERTIYQCEFCRSANHPKRLMSRRGMFLHEYSCFYNPKNRTCLTCAHNEHLYKRHQSGRYTVIGIGCLDGAVTAEVEKEWIRLTDIFDIHGNWDCPKYEYDNGESVGADLYG